MDADYEIDDEGICPKCHNAPVHYRSCTNWCEEGWIDESDDDPINYMPGESERMCPECKGTGVECWCPNCGENLSGKNLTETSNQ